MKNFLVAVVMISSFSAFSKSSSTSYSIDLESPEILRGEGELQINAEIFLSQDSYIFADRIVFGANGVIYTHGYKLRIVARNIVFSNRVYGPRMGSILTRIAENSKLPHDQYYDIKPHIAITKENDNVDVNPFPINPIEIVAKNLTGNPIIFGTPFTKKTKLKHKEGSAPILVYFAARKSNSVTYQTPATLISKPGLDFDPPGPENSGQIVFEHLLRPLYVIENDFLDLWQYSLRTATLGFRFEKELCDFMIFICDEQDKISTFKNVLEGWNEKIKGLRITRQMQTSPTSKENPAHYSLKAYSDWSAFVSATNSLIYSLKSFSQTRFDLDDESQAALSAFFKEAAELRNRVQSVLVKTNSTDLINADKAQEIFELSQDLKSFSLRVAPILQNIVNDRVSPTQQDLKESIFEYSPDLNADILKLYTLDKVSFVTPALSDGSYTKNLVADLVNQEPYDTTYSIEKLYYTIAPPPGPPPPPHKHTPNRKYRLVDQVANEINSRIRPQGVIELITDPPTIDEIRRKPLEPLKRIFSKPPIGRW